MYREGLELAVQFLNAERSSTTSAVVAASAIVLPLSGLIFVFTGVKDDGAEIRRVWGYRHLPESCAGDDFDSPSQWNSCGVKPTERPVIAPLRSCSRVLSANRI